MKDNSITVYIITILSLWSCQTKQFFTAPRDGQQYPYIEFEQHYWMTENMRYNVEGSMLNPDNPDPIYGRLYNWHQAQKVCPDGWFLPLSSHFIGIELLIIKNKEDLYIDKRFRGDASILKSKEGWNPPGTDSLGLNVLPAGRADKNGFAYLGETAFLWTGNSHMWGGELAEQYAYYRYLHADSMGIKIGNHNKNTAYYSCRCIQYIEPKKKK